MNQSISETLTLAKRLQKLRPGERLVYGRINRLGVKLVDLSVAQLVNELEIQGKVMPFQRKLGPHYGYELVAVGTTPKLNERILEIVESYEQKMGLTKKRPRSID